MNVLYGGASKLSQNTFVAKRHEKCPLRELPEKIPDLEHGYENVEKSIIRIGFNACLDEIFN